MCGWLWLWMGAALGRRDMYSINMTGSLPDTVGGLKQLVHLDLPYNQIEGTIPQSLRDLQQLVVLNLRYNRLTGVVPSLPFKNYTGGCYLQSLASPSNHYTCPLPPVKALSRAPRAPRAAAPSPPCTRGMEQPCGMFALAALRRSSVTLPLALAGPSLECARACTCVSQPPLLAHYTDSTSSL